MPGYTQNLTATADIALDVAGIAIVGLALAICDHNYHIPPPLMALLPSLRPIVQLSALISLLHLMMLRHWLLLRLLVWERHLRAVTLQN